MADMKVVEKETGQHQEQAPVPIEPAVLIGWMPDGKFACITRLDPHRALALIETAKLHVLSEINPDKQVPNKVVVATPPAGVDLRRGNGRPH